MRFLVRKIARMQSTIPGEIGQKRRDAADARPAAAPLAEGADERRFVAGRVAGDERRQAGEEDLAVLGEGAGVTRSPHPPAASPTGES
jgi:hypothetical protein